MVTALSVEHILIIITINKCGLKFVLTNDGLRTSLAKVILLIRVKGYDVHQKGGNIQLWGQSGFCPVDWVSIGVSELAAEWLSDWVQKWISEEEEWATENSIMRVSKYNLQQIYSSRTSISHTEPNWNLMILLGN